MRQLRSPLQQSILGRNTDDEKLTEPRDWDNLLGEINNDAKLCHGPEDGHQDQSLVGMALPEKGFKALLLYASVSLWFVFP